MALGLNELEEGRDAVFGVGEIDADTEAGFVVQDAAVHHVSDDAHIFTRFVVL